jgi:hypothetical protein
MMPECQRLLNHCYPNDFAFVLSLRLLVQPQAIEVLPDLLSTLSACHSSLLARINSKWPCGPLVRRAAYLKSVGGSYHYIGDVEVAILNNWNRGGC